MTRPLDAGVSAAASAANLTLCAAVKLEFASGTVLANTSPYPLTINGETYLGVGLLGNVSTVEESIELQSSDVTLTLSGVDPANIGLALGGGYKQRPAQVYAVFLDDDHRIIGTPPLIFQGLMDVMAVNFGADGTASIALSVSNRLANWDTPRIRRYTDEDQQAAYPGDLGCSFVAAMQDKVVLWGQKTTP